MRGGREGHGEAPSCRALAFLELSTRSEAPGRDDAPRALGLADAVLVSLSVGSSLLQAGPLVSWSPPNPIFWPSSAQKATTHVLAEMWGCPQAAVVPRLLLCIYTTEQLLVLLGSITSHPGSALWNWCVSTKHLCLLRQMSVFPPQKYSQPAGPVASLCQSQSHSTSGGTQTSQLSSPGSFVVLVCWAGNLPGSAHALMWGPFASLPPLPPFQPLHGCRWC